MITRIARSAALAATVAAVTLTGCGTAHQASQGHGTQVIVKRDASNGKTVKMSVGDKLKLVLSSSYWNFNGSSDSRVLRQVGAPVLVKTTRTCVPGGGCQPKRVTFRALKPGTAVITAHRVSCGEALACSASKRNFKLTVVVS